MFGGHSEPEFQREIHALRPEVGIADGEAGAGRAGQDVSAGDGGGLRRVDHPIDLFAGSSDRAGVQERIADDEARPGGQPNAAVEIDFRDDGELSAILRANVRWLSEVAARKKKFS